MKSLHFCTPKLLQYIKTHSKFTTIRTGFVPNIYAGDIINIIDKTQNNKIICCAKVLFVRPASFIQLDEFDLLVAEEIGRYKRNFHPEHYFFIIRLEKTEVMFF